MKSKMFIKEVYLYYYRRAVLKKLSSKFDEFLAGRSQFDGDHGVDFSAPTCCQSATFVRPLFEFYCPLFFYEKIIINNAELHFMPRMNTVFALDVAPALWQINR